MQEYISPGDYAVQHAQRYKALVAAFKPIVPADKSDRTTENSDVIVASRLRPLLQDEILSRVPQGVYERQGPGGTLDVHELKRPIRGPPALPTIKVSHTGP